MKKVAKKYSNKGITLITLVVTIIVLIILAGVSINLMLGEKGIITIAKQAKENIELAKVEEETRLNELYVQIEAEGISSGDASYDAITKLVEFKREIASAITDMGITTAENADVSTMSSNIRSISGASSADKVSYDNTNSGLTATNVQGAVDELNSSLSKVRIYVGSDGELHFVNANGADSVLPFSKGISSANILVNNGVYTESSPYVFSDDYKAILYSPARTLDMYVSSLNGNRLTTSNMIEIPLNSQATVHPNMYLYIGEIKKGSTFSSTDTRSWTLTGIK